MADDRKVVKIKEVSNRCHTTLHHFPEGKQRAVVNIFLTHSWRVIIKRSVAPFQEWSVCRDSTKKTLETVVMGIDCSWQKDLLCEISPFRLGIFFQKIFLGIHTGDSITLKQNPVIFVKFIFIKKVFWKYYFHGNSSSILKIVSRAS